MIAALLLTGVLAVVGAALLQQRRTDALSALAREQGWSLARRDDVWARAFEGEPFGLAAGRRAEDVLVGTCGGRDLVAFTYSYRTSSTDANGTVTSQVHRFAIATLRLPAAVPLVELRPSGWTGGLLPRLLGRTVELESEEFSARYVVRADDPRLASDLLPARTMQLLLDRPDVRVRLAGGCAVSWRRGRLDPVELLERLETLTALLDGVPDWVWRDRA